MAFTLRAAARPDEAWARQLNEAAYRPVITEQFGFWNDQDQQRQFSEKWAKGQYRVIELDGTPVGVLWAVVESDHVFVNELLIAPERQGSGLGSKVLGAVLHDAATRNLPVRLRVLIRNRARTLYERLGFEVKAVTSTHFSMSWSGSRSTMSR